MKAWRCSDAAAGDTGIILYRVTGDYGGATLLIIRREGMRDLDRFRRCGRSAATSARGAFEPGSIAIRDRAAIIQQNYRTATLHLLRLGAFGYAVAAYPDRWSGRPTIGLVEGGIFGIRAVTYPTTRVEVAGRNIISSRASEIIAALQARGASIRGGELETDERVVGSVKLSPPVGLSGVTEIEVSAVADHAYQIVYTIAGEQEYMTYVRLLDERYGSSQVRNSEDMPGCRTRYWESGQVGILGAFCRDRGYELTFVNSVVSEQLQDYREHLRQPPASPASEPRIDPDNM